MIKLTDIYTAVNGLLTKKYGYPIYGHEVVEGFDKPSFFVELKAKTMSNESTVFKKFTYTIFITYFQSTPDEIDNLTKVDEIQELFGNNLKLSDGNSINLSDYDFDFAGQNTNILQMSIETEFYDKVPQTVTYEIAKTLNLTEEG